jgi:signal transduction histidine kinase
MNILAESNLWKSFTWVALILAGMVIALLFVSRSQLHRQVIESEAMFLKAQFEQSMNALLLDELDEEISWIEENSLNERLINQAALESLDIPQVEGVQGYNREFIPIPLPTAVGSPVSSNDFFQDARLEGWVLRVLPNGSFGLMIYLLDQQESYYIEFQLNGEPLQDAWNRIDTTLIKQGSGLMIFSIVLLWSIFLMMIRRIQAKEKLLIEKTEVLKQTNQELSRAYKTTSLGALTGHLMHALKSPLTALNDLARDPSTLIKEDSIADIRFTIQQMEGLVHQALETIKETEKGEISYCLSIKELFEIARQEFAKKFALARLELNESSSLTGLFNNLQGNLILAILGNLFQNSVDAKKDVSLFIECLEEDGNWIILLTDNAGGIATALRKQLFSPMVSRKPRGSGIGLALCKQLAESMDGSLSLLSSGKQGSCFRLTVPKLESSQSPTPARI